MAVIGLPGAVCENHNDPWKKHTCFDRLWISVTEPDQYRRFFRALQYVFDHVCSPAEPPLAGEAPASGRPNTTSETDKRNHEIVLEMIKKHQEEIESEESETDKSNHEIVLEMIKKYQEEIESSPPAKQ